MKIKFFIICIFLVSIFLSGCKPEELLKVTKLQTGTITEYTATTAKAPATFIDVSGNVTDYGHCWNTTGNPTVADGKYVVSGTAQKGEYFSNLTGLTSNTKYYVNAYAIDGGEPLYGDPVDFTTNPSLPVLTTTAISNIGRNTATSGGNISGDGGSGITVRGVCWSTIDPPTISNSKTEDGSGIGSFISNLSGLSANTTYYVRAYATNAAGTGYGSTVSFPTLPPGSVPTVTTIVATDITNTSATSGGSNISEGSSAIIAKGVCWSTNPTPTINDFKTDAGPSANDYNSQITGLTHSTIYYYRAYATNNSETGYGSTYSFMTKPADVDGNVYDYITIGTQKWMKENLKTTKYNDGGAIAYPGTDNTAWTNNTYGAYAWYNNDVASKTTYGALYNWHAVNTAKLCPAGWHVPLDPEWTALENYLIANGYNYDGSTTGNKIAKALAATTNWTTSITTGAPGNTDYPDYRNKSGYTALPGGNRNTDGTFYGIGVSGYWWSATEVSTYNAWYRRIYSNFIYLSVFSNPKELGFSVRCVSD